MSGISHMLLGPTIGGNVNVATTGLAGSSSVGTAKALGSFAYVRSLNVNSRTTAPRGVYFDSTGTRLFVGDTANDRVIQYSLGTAWDISTASYVRVFSVSAQTTNPRDIFFRDNGTRMFVLDGTYIYQYNLGTAWDISTASYSSLRITQTDSQPGGIWYSSDGTKLYVVGYGSDRVTQYNLNSAWSSSGYSSSSFISVSSQTITPYNVAFNEDGTKMFVISDAARVYQYTLGTAWSVSTATFDAMILNASAQASLSFALYVGNDDADLYTVYGLSTALVLQYSR